MAANVVARHVGQPGQKPAAIPSRKINQHGDLPASRANGFAAAESVIFFHERAFKAVQIGRAASS